MLGPARRRDASWSAPAATVSSHPAVEGNRTCHFLRWLPVGLALPVLALLPFDRGLSLGQIGVLFGGSHCGRLRATVRIAAWGEGNRGATHRDPGSGPGRDVDGE